MSDADLRPVTEAPEELLADMPLPSDPKTFFPGGLFILATLATAYVARDIVLPRSRATTRTDFRLRTKGQ